MHQPPAEPPSSGLADLRFDPAVPGPEGSRAGGGEDAAPCADPAAGAGPEPAEEAGGRRAARVDWARRHGPVLLVLTGIFLLCLVNQRPGHDWGDDFALYLRQGASLIDGNVDQVLADNRFTVDNSSWHTFSPDAYPWGWPLLIAPVYAIWGIDYGVLKAFEAALFCGFLFAFWSVTRRRLGEVVATLVLLAIGFSITYVGWTDTALSEFPYLAAVGLCWWWHDRCRERGVHEAGARWPLVALGVAIGFAYSVRREGMALVAGLALFHVARLVQRRRAERGRPWAAEPWGRMALPYASAFAFVIGLQLLLPSVLFQKYPDAGLHQLKPNAIWFRDILAEIIGLKDMGVNRIELLGSRWLGLFVLTAFVVLAVVGVLVRAGTAAVDDAMLVGYGVAVCLVIGVQPFHEGRYLFSIAPLMLYFAVHAVAFLAAGRHIERRTARAAAVGFVALFVVANGTDLYRRTEGRLATDYYVVPGPEDPDAQALFQAIAAYSEPDDVIGFFRARAMNLYGGRRSVQVTTVDDVLRVTDVYAMEKGSTYSQVLLTDDEAALAGLVKLWESPKYVLWQVSPT